MTDSNAFGYMAPTDTQSEFQRQQFQIEQAMGRKRTVTLAKVIAVSVSDAVGPTGTVDVQPLVNMVDGQGQNATEHGTIHSIPYMRVAGGNNAVINDPQVGDIGILLVSDRDISGVVAAKGAATPGSGRRMDLSDSLYLGTVLGSTPQQYLQFVSGGGINVQDQYKNAMQFTSAGITAQDFSGNTMTLSEAGITLADIFGNTVTLASGLVKLVNAGGAIMTIGPTGAVVSGNLTVSGTLITSGTMSGTIDVIGGTGGGAISLTTHRHTGVTVGGGTTGLPT